MLALESAGPGGAEQVVLRLALGLRERGHRVHLLTLREGWLTERADAQGLPRWCMPQGEGLAPRWTLALARRLREHGIELLHAHEFAAGVYGAAAARLAGVPALVTLHGHGWVTERARRRLAVRALARAGTGLAAVSHELAGHLARTLPVPRERVAVLPNGTRLGPRRAGRGPAAAALRRELAGAAPLLAAAGSLVPVKDHASLLRALAALPGVVLAVAGRGPEEVTLRRLAIRLGVADRVRLLGLRDDVPVLLSAADLLVHPSRREGLPMAVLEAMAASRPVVATRVGGIPEAVRDGETGLLVPPGDPAALAAALEALLTDRARAAQLGRAGRERAEAEFSLERMLDRHRAVYAALGAGRRGRARAAPPRGVSG